MSKKELEQRIEELRNVNKIFDLITDDSDETQILDDIEGVIDEAICFYEEKLDELKTVDINQGFEYQMAIRENVVHRM